MTLLFVLPLMVSKSRHLLEFYLFTVTQIAVRTEISLPEIAVLSQLIYCKSSGTSLHHSSSLIHSPSSTQSILQSISLQNKFYLIPFLNPSMPQYSSSCKFQRPGMAWSHCTLSALLLTTSSPLTLHSTLLFVNTPSMLISLPLYVLLFIPRLLLPPFSLISSTYQEALRDHPSLTK